MPVTKPTPFTALGRLALATVKLARAPFARREEGGGPEQGFGFLPTVPSGRSVPLPVLALTRLLDQHPSARHRLKHLALIETSCRLSPGDPLAHVPPRTLEIAIRQLEPVVDQHHGLHVLRLQLERRLQHHRARVDAALALDDRRWRPDAGASTFGPLELDGNGQLAFAETLPLETTARG